MSSTLPPRLYYTPEESAEALSDHFSEKVTPAYLFHLAATSRLRLAATGDDMVAALIPSLYRLVDFKEDKPVTDPREIMTSDAVAGARALAPWDFSGLGFFILPSQYALSLQRRGVAHVTQLIDYLDKEGAGAESPESFSMVKRIQKKLDESGLPQRFTIGGLDCISMNEPTDMDFLKNYNSMSQMDLNIQLAQMEKGHIRVERDSIVILLSEIERLMSGAPLEQRPDTAQQEKALLRLAQDALNTKTKNAYLRLIDAMRRLILDEKEDYMPDSKAAACILTKFTEAEIPHPIGDRKLFDYLREAREDRPKKP